jgi:hypothetical protein
MVFCTNDMYVNNGYKNISNIESLNKNLCPDPVALKDIWSLKNGYESVATDRKSFSIQAVRCNQENDASCAPKEDIEYLMARVYFTFFVLEDKVKFILENLKENNKPYTTVNKFHSQF